MRRRQIILEMETSDLDDALALTWLAANPRVELLGVVVTPGTDDQCGVVRHILDSAEHPRLPIGAFSQGSARNVSPYHYVLWPNAKNLSPGPLWVGSRLIEALLSTHPDATVLTVGPPKNLGAWLRASQRQCKLKRWVCQGGFAGTNIVPREKQLCMFAGAFARDSHNLDAAAAETLALLESSDIEDRIFVSKNVCNHHKLMWNETRKSFYERLRALARPYGYYGPTRMAGCIERIQHNGYSQSLSDVLAACVAVDESICTYTSTALTRAYLKGEWYSSTMKPQNNCRISTALSPTTDFATALLPEVEE